MFTETGSRRFPCSAESVGFEPTRPVTRPSGFQDRRHRPLGELSLVTVTKMCQDGPLVSPVPSVVGLREPRLTFERRLPHYPVSPAVPGFRVAIRRSRRRPAAASRR